MPVTSEISATASRKDSSRGPVTSTVRPAYRSPDVSAATTTSAMSRTSTNGSLPPLLTLTSEVWDCPLTPFLMDEMARDEPGQEVVLDRLLDLLVIAALRAWFSRPEAEAPAWYRALADPVVGRVLRLLQDDPAHPWTVASLATKAGVSRAALARRFTELVGEPPMTYLTGWRLALAADRLRDTDDTLEAIARQVGYGSAFALSSAFKRVYGVSPQEHRTRAA